MTNETKPDDRLHLHSNSGLRMLGPHHLVGGVEMKQSGDPTVGPGDTVEVECVHSLPMVQVIASSPHDPMNCRCEEEDRQCAALATEEDGFCDLCRHDQGVRHHVYLVRR